MKKQLIKEVDKILVDNSISLRMGNLKRRDVARIIVNHVVLKIDKLRFEKKPL